MKRKKTQIDFLDFLLFYRLDVFLINYADNLRCDMDTCVGLSSGTAGLYKMSNKESGKCIQNLHERSNVGIYDVRLESKRRRSSATIINLCYCCANQRIFHILPTHYHKDSRANIMQFAGQQRLAIILTGPVVRRTMEWHRLGEPVLAEIFLTLRQSSSGESKKILVDVGCWFTTTRINFLSSACLFMFQMWPMEIIK